MKTKNDLPESVSLPADWWAHSADELLKLLEVNPDRGLSGADVDRNREQFGVNRHGETNPTGLWTLLWESARSPMMVLLLTIAVISLALGQIREALVMVFVVASYVGVHLLNKVRSDRTMARLRQVQAPGTRVLREGRQQEILMEQVVVGDILPLQSGSRVPADARLISAVSLMVNEAALTGESIPVLKTVDLEISVKTPLAERVTVVYSGTTILDGQGKALVIAVGGASEQGKAARLSAAGQMDPTPLQKEMSGLARTLAFAAVGVSLLIPLAGLLRGFNFQQMVLTWLSLTFLMVPGQPPIIIAMALALASLELARKQVIVRRLQGAETLGSVDVVLSDKTGTMTKNKMRLSAVLLPDEKRLTLEDLREKDQKSLALFLELATQAIPEDANNPTDLAILQAAENLKNFNKPAAGRLVHLAGFSAGGAYRSLEYIRDRSHITFYTGRPEFIIDHATRKIGTNSRVPETVAWPQDEREQFKQMVAALGRDGQRVTAYAYKEGKTANGEPQRLVFAGAAVISDPIRPEVKEAVRELKTAGIRTVMVTGDIRETAAAVADAVGFEESSVIVGQELDGKSDEELDEMVRHVSIFARATPENKLNLVRTFQRLGQTVAVTGDGINDAPALHSAHIGIAMGQKGTDTAREAADLILTDDNFAHLPAGVAIGRKAYDNFRKGITYYLSAKAILLTIFLIPLMVGVEFPLAPIQIIFTELLMDLASSTIFVTEAAEPDVMMRRPRKRGSFLSWQVARRIFRNMAGLTIAILIVFFTSLAWGYGIESARTAAFATWLLGHIVLALNLKQDRMPLFKQGLFSNRFAAGWLAGMVLLTLAMTSLPFAQSILLTTGLRPSQWGMVLGGALLASMWMEVAKWMRLRGA